LNRKTGGLFEFETNSPVIFFAIISTAPGYALLNDLICYFDLTCRL